jgi:hypothetical protein
VGATFLQPVAGPVPTLSVRGLDGKSVSWQLNNKEQRVKPLKELVTSADAPRPASSHRGVDPDGILSWVYQTFDGHKNSAVATHACGRRLSGTSTSWLVWGGSSSMAAAGSHGRPGHSSESGR